jgi:hypothetical protein
MVFITKVAKHLADNEEHRLSLPWLVRKMVREANHEVVSNTMSTMKVSYVPCQEDGTRGKPWGCQLHLVYHEGELFPLSERWYERQTMRLSVTQCLQWRWVMYLVKKMVREANHEVVSNTLSIMKVSYLPWQEDNVYFINKLCLN